MSDDTKKPKKGFKVILVTGLLVVGAALMVGFSYNKIEKQKQNELEVMQSTVDTGTIYDNIFVNDINVGGLTEEEAYKKINEELNNKVANKKITISDDKNSFEFPFKDFGFKFDIKSGLDEVLQYANGSNLKERYNKIIELEQTPYKVELKSEYDRSLVEKNIDTISESVYVDYVNATMKREDGEFIIIEGSDGSKLDVSNTAKQIYTYLDNFEDGKANIIMQDVERIFKSKDLEDAKQLIGTGKSYYNGRGSGRVTNMDVAASHINNYVVYPGEVFSTNAAFGETTAANGYKNAPVIEKGELIEGMGGGVCQISSTLYNALLYSELEIVERRNHSLKVGYMNWGFDATLAGDYIDLKFKNDTNLPVIIECFLTSNEVVTNIYGKEVHSPNRRLEFKNALISTTPPAGEQVSYNPNASAGSRTVKVNALTGYVYDVYKSVFENDELIETVQVNRSTYAPRRAQVIVGTGGEVSSTDITEQPKDPVEQPQTTEQPQAPVEQLPTIEQEEISQEPIIQEPPITQEQTPQELPQEVETSPTNNEPVID